MIAIKLLGGALILSAGGLAAFGTARREKKKLAVLEGWIDLVFYIRGQIDCFLAPLDEILASADPTLLRACMGCGRERSLEPLLRLSQPFLEEESRRLLTALVREIGGSYREEQVKRCDYYLTALRALREKRAAELPSRVKLCVTLCLCAAAGTTILLW